MQVLIVRLKAHYALPCDKNYERSYFTRILCVTYTWYHYLRSPRPRISCCTESGIRIHGMASSSSSLGNMARHSSEYTTTYTSHLKLIRNYRVYLMALDQKCL